MAYKENFEEIVSTVQEVQDLFSYPIVEENTEYKIGGNQISDVNLDSSYKLIFDNSEHLTIKLLDTHQNSFKLVYLDPPYNTKRTRGARKFYSDTKENWEKVTSTIIENTYHLLRDDGFLAISINQMELFNLKKICDNYFKEDCFIGLFPIKIRHSERQLMINATYHDVYEYLLFYRKNKKTRFITEDSSAKLEKFVYDVVIKEDKPIRKNINDKLIEIYQPHQYEIVKKMPSLDLQRRYIIAGKLATANWSGEFFETHLRAFGKDLLIKVHGLDKEGLGYRWFQSQNDKRNSGVYFQSSLTAGRPILPTNDLDFTEIVPNIYKEGGKGCDFKDSKKPEQLLEFIIKICTNKNDLVGDFYAGSGTTLASCIKTNRSCITSENNETSFNIIENRINNLKQGLDISNEKYNFEIEVIK